MIYCMNVVTCTEYMEYWHAWKAILLKVYYAAAYDNMQNEENMSEVYFYMTWIGRNKYDIKQKLTLVLCHVLDPGSYLQGTVHMMSTCTMDGFIFHGTNFRGVKKNNTFVGFKIRGHSILFHNANTKLKFCGIHGSDPPRKPRKLVPQEI